MEMSALMQAAEGLPEPRKASNRKGGNEGRFELPDAIGEGERNDVLFRYACQLRGYGATRDEIYSRLEEANVRCDPPLGESELIGIASSAMKYSPNDGISQAHGIDTANTALGHSDQGKRPIHRIVADYLMQECGARFVAGAPVVRDGLCYSAGWFYAERRITERFPDLKKAQRSEALSLVNLEAPRGDKTNERYIGFANGVLDVRTMQFHPDGVSAVVTNEIPHRWNPKAECHAVDAFLDSVSCGDSATRANLEELVGHCLYRGKAAQRFWVLLGGGGNGKSAFLDALGFALGTRNYTTMQPEELATQFQANAVVGKLAILADDASSQTISEKLSASIKRISAGNVIHTDIKYHDGIDFRPYATIVLGYNNFPAIKSNDHGFMRRFTPVLFEAEFGPDKPGYDPYIAEKLSTEKAAERLLVLGVTGLRRMLDRGCPTPNLKAETLRDGIHIDNDSVAAWIRYAEVTQKDVLERTPAEVFRDYREWCEDNETQAKSLVGFGRSLTRTLKVTAHKVRVGDKTRNEYEPMESA